jgi:hypothetical protein
VDRAAGSASRRSTRAHVLVRVGEPGGGVDAPAAERQRDLLGWFGGWHRPIADLIRATPTETILLNEIADRAPRRGWSRGPATLLGDAAHAMTPNLGQGACSAIATVWWPHRASGASALDHTRAFRGRIVPAVFLHHTYHLEHHLYPGRLGELAVARERLDPYLTRAGVEPIVLP